MQKQIITQAENGFIIEHNGKHYVETNNEGVTVCYIRDFERVVKNMKPGETLAVSLEWELNPVQHEIKVVPEIDIDATIKRMIDLNYFVSVESEYSIMLQNAFNLIVYK